MFGTRTTRELIWAGANMARFLRWGNWAVAKLIEALYNTSHLSDVGCTYRLLRSDTAKRVAEAMTVGGSHAGVEIMLLTILSGARFVEVPVNYLPRVGHLVGHRRPDQGGRSVGLQMIWPRAARCAARLRTRVPAPRRRSSGARETSARPHERLPL